MYVQFGDFRVSRGPTTVPLTRISCNMVFSKSQNARKAGTLCKFDPPSKKFHNRTVTNVTVLHTIQFNKKLSHHIDYAHMISEWCHIFKNSLARSLIHIQWDQIYLKLHFISFNTQSENFLISLLRLHKRSKKGKNTSQIQENATPYKFRPHIIQCHMGWNAFWRIHIFTWFNLCPKLEIRRILRIWHRCMLQEWVFFWQS